MWTVTTTTLVRGEEGASISIGDFCIKSSGKKEGGSLWGDSRKVREMEKVWRYTLSDFRLWYLVEDPSCYLGLGVTGKGEQG